MAFIYDRSKTELENEEILWQVIKAMLDEFPALKEKIRKYVSQKNPK